MQEPCTSSLVPARLTPRLKTAEFGRVYRYLAEVDSTNSLARALAEAGAPSGALVAAEIQTGGRGRLGRPWVSPPGGIWLSLLLRPPLTPAAAPLQTLLAAVALREVLQEGEGLQAAIKWPNDVLCRGKKVAGILTEMKAKGGELEYLVAGVGINANFPGTLLPPHLREKGGTLMDLLGRPLDRPGLVSAFLLAWEGYYRQAVEEGYGEALAKWRRHNVTLGKRVLIDTGRGRAAGRALDIDAGGGLIVETGPGCRETFLAGEVTLLEG